LGSGLQKKEFFQKKMRQKFILLIILAAGSFVVFSGYHMKDIAQLSWEMNSRKLVNIFRNTPPSREPDAGMLQLKVHKMIDSVVAGTGQNDTLISPSKSLQVGADSLDEPPGHLLASKFQHRTGRHKRYARILAQMHQAHQMHISKRKLVQTQRAPNGWNYMSCSK
jgi:hypothetical protein